MVRQFTFSPLGSYVRAPLTDANLPSALIVGGSDSETTMQSCQWPHILQPTEAHGMAPSGATQ